MAKGGDSQRNNGSRFTKPYNVSNSFVTKVASRVSDYLGGWFGTPVKSSNNASATETSSMSASGDTSSRRVLENVHGKRLLLSHSVFDDVDLMSSPSKRFKISERDKVGIDFPISPIPSTSGLFQSTINHSYDIPKSEDIERSEPGPSSLQTERFQSNILAPATSSTTTDVKANGATDNHSDSSESTSGCSSLVPQSDRLSQSAYVCSSRKRTLEDKLKYARQLHQSRAAMFLNRSIPASEAPGTRKKPCFDVTAYGTPSIDKSLLREKLINSPFYTGQTSYGGASAYKMSRNTFYSHKSPRMTTERREGVPVKVKPSHHGSTEDLTNMSHTAKKILEALEQFSTPVSDAKRIPVSRLNVPLGSKRGRFEEGSEARMRLSTPISPLNPNPSPVITGLNVPTVPDLLKLKRLERIQNSTAAARQVAVPKPTEYVLPSDVLPEKHTGKIVTKLKDKKKDVPFERLEEVNLPKVPLPITTLPKFEFNVPPATKSVEKNKVEGTEKPKSKNFTFSPPISISVSAMPETFAQKKNFTFRDPLRADGKRSELEVPVSTPLTNFITKDPVTKLKRKSINETSSKTSGFTIPPVATELKTGSVMDFFNKNKDEKECNVKPSNGTWECNNCLIRNLNDNKICCGCKAVKVNEEKPRTITSPPKVDSVSDETKSPPKLGFGDKFKPPPGNWSCKECFVSNKASAAKCVCCESPKPSTEPAAAPAKEPPKVEVLKPPVENKSGFGDLFKKQANQWECSVCLIRNKDTDTKCAACETPKPGSKPEKIEPKFTFGIPPAGGGFKFGIDKADTDSPGVKSAADSSSFKFQSNGPKSEETPKPSQFSAISTSVGVFTFGIPPASAQNKKEEPLKTDTTKTTTETTNTSSFLVTSTSGSNIRKDESLAEKQEEKKSVPEKVEEKQNDNVSVNFLDKTKTGNEQPKPFFFGIQNKSLIKPFSETVSEEKPKVEQEAKAPKFVFGTNSNSNSLETVSSSTTDFTFSQGKITTSQSTAPDSGLNKPQLPFQSKPFGSTDETQFKLGSNTSAEINKSKATVTAASDSAANTAAPSLFAPSTAFNSAPKMMFGTTTPSFGISNLPTTSSTLFGTSTQSFATSSFNTKSSAAPTSKFFNAGTTSEQPTFTTTTQQPTFATATQPPTFATTTQEQTFTTTTQQPTFTTTTPFGNALGGFSAAPNPFASTATSTQNQEPAKTFGNFRSTPAVPMFNSNPAPAPAFGSNFLQSSNTTEKPATPFVFGASTPAVASTSAPTQAAPPGVFTFGAPKQETKTQFSFNKICTPNFNFGSNTSNPTVFGGFGQPKPEHSLGTSLQSTPFGAQAPSSIFGQSSAPAAFEAPAPKFEFGASASQQQESSPAVFKFGATPSQPATAPATFGFNFNVPQKFDVDGNEESSSSENRKARKVIKAVRRTNRDTQRRPN